MHILVLSPLGAASCWMTTSHPLELPQQLQQQQQQQQQYQTVVRAGALADLVVLTNLAWYRVLRRAFMLGRQGTANRPELFPPLNLILPEPP